MDRCVNSKIPFFSVQDVLQCQLEDLDNEVRDLRKALSVTEDHLV